MMDDCATCHTRITSLTRGLFRTTTNNRKGRGHQITTWHHLEDGHDDHPPTPANPKKRTSTRTTRPRAP